LHFKKTTQYLGGTGCDPFASKGRGEPSDRINVVKRDTEK